MVYLHNRHNGCIGYDIRIGVKFGVARFDNGGQFSGALNCKASDEWASRFLFICLELLLNFGAEAPSYQYMFV